MSLESCQCVCLKHACKANNHKTNLQVTSRWRVNWLSIFKFSTRGSNATQCYGTKWYGQEEVLKNINVNTNLEFMEEEPWLLNLGFMEELNLWIIHVHSSLTFYSINPAPLCRCHVRSNIKNIRNLSDHIDEHNPTN